MTCVSCKPSNHQSDDFFKFGTRLKPLTGTQFVLNPVSLPTDFHFSGTQLLPTRDQGQCGGCWAFALTSSLHNRIAIYTSDKIRIPLAPQQLIDCMTQDANGCDGASLEGPVLQIESSNFQIVPETDYPYQGVNGPCYQTQSDYTVTIAKHYVLTQNIDTIGDATHLQNIENIKQAIYQHGPVVFGMNVYPSFRTYDGVSIYEPKDGETSLGGHAVLGVGWGVSSEGVPYWVCRNSWSAAWPAKHLDYYGPGVFFMRMGINNCTMEEQAISSIPKVTGKDIDTSVIPTPEEIEHQGIYHPGPLIKIKKNDWYRILIVIAAIVVIIAVNKFYPINMYLNVAILVLITILCFVLGQ